MALLKNSLLKLHKNEVNTGPPFLWRPSIAAIRNVLQRCAKSCLLKVKVERKRDWHLTFGLL